MSVVDKIKNFAGDLWKVQVNQERRVRGMLIVAARILVTVVMGIVKKRVLVQASSLSYATLLAVGPILAITVMFSSAFFKDKDDRFVYDNIMAAATFVLPAFNEMIKEGEDATTQPVPSAEANQSADSKPNASGTTAAQLPADAVASQSASTAQNSSATQPVAQQSAEVSAESAHGKIKVNPKIYEFIENVSKSSVKGGVFGVVAMLFTCLLLFINMESAFNYIWGVSKGRNWINRVVFYFVMVFFGSVGSIFAAALFATPVIARAFGDIVFIRDYIHWISYGFGAVIMAVVLSGFYKFIPFTNVSWRSAIAGGVIITLLLLLNNKASFLYIAYIAKQESLYGYLAIVAVAMFSLYIFWAVLLSGGLIAYSIQFVGFFDDDQTWNKIGDRTKRMCALAVFCEVSKEFYARGSGCGTLDQLSAKLKLPKVMLSVCVKWLVEKDLVCLVENPDDNTHDTIKPSLPPDSITVAEFIKTLSEYPSDKSVNERLSGYENAVSLTLSALYELSSHEVFSKKIKDIM